VNLDELRKKGIEEEWYGGVFLMGGIMMIVV
jgi:hypothetical protein